MSDDLANEWIHCPPLRKRFLTELELLQRRMQNFVRLPIDRLKLCIKFRIDILRE